MMKAFVVSMIIHVATIYGYEFICPDRSHLRIYSKAACKNPLDFTCLKDVLLNKYRTDCDICKPIPPGLKYVFFGQNYDADECEWNRYQPFVFIRNQQTDCVYIKSACNEEGQIVYSHGSTTFDVKCKCDEKNGFTYVTQPRNKSFCVPSEEDCSCYRKPNNAVTNNEPYNTSRPNLTMTINTTLIDFPTFSQVNVIKDCKETAYSNKTIACIFVAVMLVIIIGVGVLFCFFERWAQGTDDHNKGVGVLFWFFKRWVQGTDDNNKGQNLISKLGKESQQRFLNLLKDGFEIKRDIRVIVVGKKEAGKTCLIRHLRSKTIKDVQATDGIEIHSIICKDDTEKNISWREKTHTPDQRLRLCTEEKNHSGPDDGSGKSEAVNGRFGQSETKQTENKTTDAEIVTEVAEAVNERSGQSGTKQTENNTTNAEIVTGVAEAVNERSGQSGTKQTENKTINAEIVTEVAEAVNERFGQSGTKQTENNTPNAEIVTKVIFHTLSASEHLQQFDDIPESLTRTETAKTEKTRKENTSYVEINEEEKSSSDLKSKEIDSNSTGNSHRSIHVETNTIQPDKDYDIYQVIKDMKNAKKIGKSDIRISIWDFGGDEEFYYTHQMFLAENVVYLIVTSLELSEDSSDKEFEFEFWFNTIHCLCENFKTDKLSPRCIVVGTKTDLCQDADSVLEEKLQSVPKGLRKHISGKSFLISNKKADDNTITDIKRAIIDAAKEGKEWETKHPVKFIFLDKALDKKRHELETRPVMTLNDIEAINNSLEQPLDPDDLVLYLRYNHLAGHLIYFEDIPDCIVIKPQWLCDLFRCIVTADKFRPSELPQHDLKELRSTGKITDTLLEDIFRIKKIDFKFQQYLMEIMEKFHIVIQLSELTENKSKMYFAPCMVRGRAFDVANLSTDDAITVKSTWLCLECDFIPPFLFNHIIISLCEEYRGVGDLPQFYSDGAVLDISTNRCDKLVILKLRNVIQLQTMMLDQPNIGKNIYIKSFLTRKMEELTKTFF